RPRLGRDPAASDPRRAGAGGARGRPQPAPPEQAPDRGRCGRARHRRPAARPGGVRRRVPRARPDWSEVETVVRKTRARIDDAVHGATRAPYAALDLIAGARDWTPAEGYAAEKRAMAELLVSR